MSIRKKAQAVVDGFEVMDAQGPEFFATIKRLRAALSEPDARDAVVSWRTIEDVTRDSCSCGGGGPDDPHTCSACMVWHRLKAMGGER